MSTTITLDEYKMKAENFWGRFKTVFLADAKDDEVYYASSQIRKDMVDKVPFGIRSSAFKSYKNIEELMYKNWNYRLECYEDIDADECDIEYWQIEKYRQKDGEYQKIFTLYASDWGTFLDLEFEDPSIFLTDEENKLYIDYEYLRGQATGMFELKIEFPYKAGDVIKLEHTPFTNDTEYFIYCRDDIVIRKDDNDNLYITRLFGHKFNRPQFAFEPLFMQLSDTCIDPILYKISLSIADMDDQQVESMINEYPRHIDTETRRSWQNRINNYFSEIIVDQKIAEENN